MPNWSWLAHILPQLEQNSQYQQTGIGANPPPNINQCLPQIAQPVKMFICPSDGLAAQRPAELSPTPIITTCSTPCLAL